LWSDWGDELPLFEASVELDPPIEERTEHAAWHIARAARTKATIYRSEFDGTERPPAPPKSPGELAAVATKIEASWPHNKKTTKDTKSTKTE
jgi:hypothetical protein